MSRVLSVKGCVWCADMLLVVEEEQGSFVLGKYNAREVEPPKLGALPEAHYSITHGQDERLSEFSAEEKAEIANFPYFHSVPPGSSWPPIKYGCHQKQEHRSLRYDAIVAPFNCPRLV